MQKVLTSRLPYMLAMNCDIPKLFDRATKTLCEDSLHLCYEATLAPHEMASRALARASFSATTMFLEAAANACLDTLDISEQLIKKIDKFPVAQKFEFFAQTKFNERMDYSLHIVQHFNELFQVRNRFVHPKAQALEWKSIGNGVGVGVAPTSKSLSIPLISTYFTAAHAVCSVRVCHIFFKYFLIDLCKINARSATAIIFSQLGQPTTGGIALGPFLYKHMQTWLNAQGILLEHFEHGFHS